MNVNTDRRTFLQTVASGLPAALALASCSSGDLFQGAVPCRWRDGGERRRIAVVGDLQRATSTLPGLVSSTGIAMGSYTRNDAERSAIIEAVAHDEPDMLLLLGDQVEDGDDPSDWAYFDRVMSPIAECGIPTWAILGNHDYGSLGPPEADQQWRRNFLRRFPHQSITPLVEIPLDDYVLLVVDSNLPAMTGYGIDLMVAEYRKRLVELDERSDVRGVIVAMHHPPVTNGGYGFGLSFGPGGMIDQLKPLFARPFVNARKTTLFLSGHVHSYQRFIPTEGKQFIVSGGGGGPRHRIDIGPGRRFHDDADVFRTVAERPFHYLMLDLRDDRICMQARMLDPGSGRFYIGDSSMTRAVIPARARRASLSIGSDAMTRLP